MQDLDYQRMEWTDGDLYLMGMRRFDLENTLDSGQAFRWQRREDGLWEGVACGRVLRLGYRDDALVLHDTTPHEFETLWRDYFDLGRDYGALWDKLGHNPVLARAGAFAPGVRVLRQPPFEALLSFILSQNNNIKRIKGLVERLCEQFGKSLGDGFYAFPEPADLAGKTPEDLAPVRAGFRAKYLIDAANRVHRGELVLDELYTLPLDEAREQLRTIHGVGPKVAECVLLYGFARTECIPVDVWIDRALRHLFPNGFPQELAPWGGLAQHTLFHYVRCCADALPAETTKEKTTS